MTEIPSSCGAIDTFIAYPSDGGPFAPVFVYMDVWGLREELFDVARRIATVGYFCLVPNFYHRLGKVRNEFRNRKGEMITLDKLPAAHQEQVLAPLKQLTDEMVVEDTKALLKYADRNELVRGGPVGSIGYCMGGRHVFRAVQYFPSRFKASASLHGTDLVTTAPDSPHLCASQGLGELYCGFGERDRHTPPAVIATIAKTLASAPLQYKYTIHQGAEHGYALPDRDVYDKRAANRDWEIIFPMLARQLGAYSG
jgi:carboxymethylenebutenolidase